jgi:hypothetical protein
MAECPKCGAITTQVRELAWRARRVTFTEFLAAMPVVRAALNPLHKQATDASATIDRLA